MKKILVVKSVGTGETELAAFDQALYAAGINDLNLIRLSSVIPMGPKVVTAKDNLHALGFCKSLPMGSKLYLVYAEQRCSNPGEEAWAGIGWVAKPNRCGGLFVEHEDKSQKKVSDDISKTLRDMLKYRHTFNPNTRIHKAIIGTKCIDKPVCALVAALYQAEDWEGNKFDC
jgi:arginine decarboxylase